MADERCELCDRPKAFRIGEGVCAAHQYADVYNGAVEMRAWPQQVDVEFKWYTAATDDCRAHRVDWRALQLRHELELALKAIRIAINKEEEIDG